MAKTQTAPKTPTLEEIKAAIKKNCGGWASAEDGEYLAKWKSLTPETREEYLRSVRAGD